MEEKWRGEGGTSKAILNVYSIPKRIRSNYEMHFKIILSAI